LLKWHPAGWADFDESQIVQYTFQSGEVEKGLLLQAPRMLVCPKSPLARSRPATDEGNTKHSHPGGIPAIQRPREYHKRSVLSNFPAQREKRTTPPNPLNL
jgi:hypothetical protein